MKLCSSDNHYTTAPQLKKKKNAEMIYYALTKSMQINLVKIIYFIICKKNAQALKNCRKSSCH